MHVLVRGSGGAAGWPEPGCRCASCLRAAPVRAAGNIVVNGVLELGAGIAPRAPAGYQVRELAGGWDVTTPAGERLLYPAGPGAVPVPPEGAAPYDVAFLDLLGDPAQLGRLRAGGLIGTDTVTAVAFGDHRVPSAAELRHRCAFWQVELPEDGELIPPARSVLKKRDPGRPWRVLVLGGARSGKSERAELRLAGEADVTYVATGPVDGDPDWAARVAAHRARRPPWWRTAETTDLAGVLASAHGALLIDGIGTWLTAVLTECGAWADTSVASASQGREQGRELSVGAWQQRVADRTAGLVAAWRQTEAHVVAVSDEAGLGVIPGTVAGRRFRDELGRLNQALAAESEETELVVAGRILALSGNAAR